VAIEHLAEEIKKLTARQRKELFKLLEVEMPGSEKRGGPNDPFTRLIGKIDGPERGSIQYREDLYGGETPL